MAVRRKAGSGDGGAMAPDQTAAEPIGQHEQRLDRWLWFTRAVKSRTVAAALIEAGKIRVNAVKVVKPSYMVRPGDVVTSAAQKDIRILKVNAPGLRRGPAKEAQLLYEDQTPKPVHADGFGENRLLPKKSGHRDAGSGRPTKRDRRLIDRLKSSE